MVKAVLFDLDGTLVDTLPLYIKSYRQALLTLGFNLADREVVDICFGKTEEVICTKLGIPSKTKEFRQFYFQGIENHFVEGKLFKGGAEFLSWARIKQIKMAIVSFAYNWYVERMVKRFKLDGYFDAVIGFDSVKKAKPDPEAALLACSKLGTLPKESVMIGDSASDIVMGSSAGCRTILFYPNSYKLFYDLTTLKKSNPGKVIKDFEELKTAILQG